MMALNEKKDGSATPDAPAGCPAEGRNTAGVLNPSGRTVGATGQGWKCRTGCTDFNSVSHG